MIEHERQAAPKVAVSEKETERSFVNSCASRSYRRSPGLVADRLDDEREDRDGKDERREQQVKLRDRPDGHAASDDGKRPVLGLLVGLRLGCLAARGRLGGQSRGAGRRVHGRGRGSGRLLVLAAHQPRGHLHRPGEHHEAGDGTEQDQQFAVHHGVCRSSWRLRSCRR